MDRPETIADIIAWLRRPREGENAYLTLWRDEIAARLDAAQRRDTKELRVEIERLKEERNYSGVRERERLRAKGFAIVPKEQLERGDCAKLREALKAISGLCAGLMPTWDGAVGRIKDMAETALAEPPRNCDRFATAEEARQAWLDDAGNWDEFGSPKLELHEWLYAPATEKEGGKDADQ